MNLLSTAVPVLLLLGLIVLIAKLMGNSVRPLFIGVLVFGCLVIAFSLALWFGLFVIVVAVIAGVSARHTSHDRPG